MNTRDGVSCTLNMSHASAKVLTTVDLAPPPAPRVRRQTSHAPTRDGRRTHAPCPRSLFPSLCSMKTINGTTRHRDDARARCERGRARDAREDDDDGRCGFENLVFQKRGARIRIARARAAATRATRGRIRANGCAIFSRVVRCRARRSRDVARDATGRPSRAREPLEAARADD